MEGLCLRVEGSIVDDERLHGRIRKLLHWDRCASSFLVVESIYLSLPLSLYIYRSSIYIYTSQTTSRTPCVYVDAALDIAAFYECNGWNPELSLLCPGPPLQAQKLTPFEGLIAEWIHFTLFGIILPTIILKVYTFWGL